MNNKTLIEEPVTFIDTLNGYDTYKEEDKKAWIDSFKDFCDCNDYDYNEKEVAAYEDDEKVMDLDDYLNQVKEEDEETFWDVINHHEKHDPSLIPCIVTGSFHSRYPEFYGKNPRTLRINQMKDFYDAIRKCLTDCYYYKIEVDNDELFDNAKVIKVTNYHHDGTNYYEIRLITSQAFDKLDEADFNGVDIDEDFIKDKSNFVEPYYELFE